MLALLSSLAGTTGLVGAALGFLGSLFTGWMARKSNEDTIKAITTSQANKEAADAEARMADANAQHRDRQSTIDRLRDGSA